MNFPWKITRSLVSYASSLKLVDRLDEVAVTVLAKVLGAQVRQLILVLDVMEANLALIHQNLDEKYLSAMCFAQGLSMGLTATCSAGVLSMYSGGELLDNTDLQAVLPKLLPGVLAALFSTPTNDAAASRRTVEQTEELDSCWSTIRRWFTWCTRWLPC